MHVPVHPLADEWTSEYALTVIEHRRVAYSRPLRHFFDDCRASERRPVLLTGPDVVLSPQLYTAMVATGASWVFREDAGWFDALSGRRVEHVTDLWRRDGAGLRHEPLMWAEPPVPAVLFDVYAGDRAAKETIVGPLAEHAVAGLGGGPLARFGADEPLVTAWDSAKVTRQAKEQMPASDPMLASSDAGAWASVTVARTRDGLLERVRGGVPLPGLAGAEPSSLREWVMPSVTAMLTDMVERFRPRVALVSAGMLRRDGSWFGYRVGAQPVDAPLAVLIGPRAVRELGLDLSELSRRHDVTSIGPGRVPAVLVRMSGRDALWAQLHAFVHDLDQERLGAMLATQVRGWF